MIPRFAILVVVAEDPDRAPLVHLRNLNVSRDFSNQLALQDRVGG